MELIISEDYSVDSREHHSTIQPFILDNRQVENKSNSYKIIETNPNGDTIEYSIDLNNKHNYPNMNTTWESFLNEITFFKNVNAPLYDVADMNKKRLCVTISIKYTYKDGTTLERKLVFKFEGKMVSKFFRNNFIETYYYEKYIKEHLKKQSYIGVYVQAETPSGPFLIYKSANSDNKTKQIIDAKERNNYETAILTNGRVHDLIAKVLEKFEETLPGINIFLMNHKHFNTMTNLINTTIDTKLVNTINDLMAINDIALPECDSLTKSIQPLKIEKTPQ